MKRAELFKYQIFCAYLYEQGYRYSMNEMDALFNSNMTANQQKEYIKCSTNEKSFPDFFIKFIERCKKENDFYESQTAADWLFTDIQPKINLIYLVPLFMEYKSHFNSVIFKNIIHNATKFAIINDDNLIEFVYSIYHYAIHSNSIFKTDMQIYYKTFSQLNEKVNLSNTAENVYSIRALLTKDNSMFIPYNEFSANTFKDFFLSKFMNINLIKASQGLYSLSEIKERIF